MDESRANRSAAIRAEEESPNEIFGLLRSRDGHIRDRQRELAVPQRHGPWCFREGIGRQASSPGGEISREPVDNVGAVLDISAE